MATPAELATLASAHITRLSYRIRDMERDLEYDITDMLACHGAQRIRARALVREAIAALRWTRDVEYSAAWQEFSMAVAVRDCRKVLVA